MTCDELRTLVQNRNSSDCTRGERAGVYGHMMNCPDCVKFVRKLEREASPTQRLENGRIADRLHEKDIQDPEFVRTVYGD